MSPNKRRANKVKVSKAPAAAAQAVVQGVPTSRNSKSGIRVQHREFFGSANSTATANPDGTYDVIWYWTIQPGYSEMFPWLSGIARRYEKYRFHNLEFEYVPRVPTSTAGSLVLALDQDPDDELPPSDESGRRTLLAHQGSVSNSVWTRVLMPYPAAWNRTGERFVRVSGETTTVEPRTADMGILYVGLFGVPASLVFGDLLVKYDIELSLPQLFSDTISTPSTALSVIGSTNNYVLGTTPLVPYPTATGSLSMLGPLSGLLSLITQKCSVYPDGTYGIRYNGTKPMAGTLSFAGSGPSTGLNTDPELRVLVADGTNSGSSTGLLRRWSKSAMAWTRGGVGLGTVLLDGLTNLVLNPGDTIIPVILASGLPSYWYNGSFSLRDFVSIGQLGSNSTFPGTSIGRSTKHAAGGRQISHADGPVPPPPTDYGSLVEACGSASTSSP